jgi:hypothetical protein
MGKLDYWGGRGEGAPPKHKLVEYQMIVAISYLHNDKKLQLS